MAWQPLSLSVRWPDYFRPEPADDAALVTMTIQAHEAGLVTKRAAVQRLSRTFGVENVDQFLATLEEEAAENQKKALAIAASGAFAPKPSAEPPAPPADKTEPPKAKP